VLLFELRLLQQLLPSLTPAAAVPAAVDAVMVMLQSVAGRAANLAVQGVQLAAVEKAVVAARQQVKAVMAERQLQAAAGVALPADAAAAAGTWRLPQGVVLAELVAAAEQQGLAAAKGREAANLPYVGCVARDQPLPDQLQQLLPLLGKYNEGSPDCAVQAALRATEQALFGAAAAGFSQPPLSPDDVPQLAAVVDAYRVALTRLYNDLPDDSLPLLHAELVSREVVVGWVAYCLIHQVACTVYPLVKQFGVPLDWHALQHLSLTDAFANSAALGVASYLHSHSNPGKELFHLSRQAPTLSFADSFADAGSSMSSMLAAHRVSDKARIAAHWSRVQQQQQEARELRDEIQQLISQRRSLERSRQELLSLLEEEGESVMTPETRRLGREINDTNLAIRSKRNKLKSAEEAPPSVIQPLPQQDASARTWLFFLHMPVVLRHLARSGCLAQQQLLPNPMSDSIRQQVEVTGLQTSLAEHYNSYQNDAEYHTPARTYTGSDGKTGFVLAMSADKAPSSIGPEDIDAFYHESDGVWYPDSMALTMAWHSSSCGCDCLQDRHLNPFTAIDSQDVAEGFTAKMPARYSSLQWALQHPAGNGGTAANRGNKGLASQGSRPGNMLKSEYLALTALRSFPTRQLHRLCECLRDKALPLDHPAVQLVVQQTVYHLGELTASSSSSSSSGNSSPGAVTHAQLWRTGWDAAGGVLEALCFELQQLASELENKPRDQGSVLLLGQLAAYLSDWHAPCKPVAQQFAAMTSRYADTQLQHRIDELACQDPDEAALAQLKARQTKWRSMSLLCFAAGPLDSSNVGHMLRMMLLVKQGDVYQPDKAAAEELAGLRILCHDVMARRLPDILSHLNRQPQLLTDAAASILQSLRQQPGGPAPPQLRWERLCSDSVPTSSYRAVDGAEHLYSINVLDGTLLFDGNPPGRLPNSILQHRCVNNAVSAGCAFCHEGLPLVRRQHMPPCKHIAAAVTVF
jgi:hypothetical protein